MDQRGRTAQSDDNLASPALSTRRGVTRLYRSRRSTRRNRGRNTSEVPFGWATERFRDKSHCRMAESNVSDSPLSERSAAPRLEVVAICCEIERHLVHRESPS